jgi:hypothetical protein
MMSKSKKYTPELNLDSLQEPVIEYNSQSEIETSELLEQLIKKGIGQSDKGETTSHEVIMARIKQKFNLPL